MITVKIVFDDPPWPKLEWAKVVVVTTPLEIAVEDKGLRSGRPSVALRLDLPDGRSVIAQITARLFCTTARAIMAKYPNLFDDE